MASSGERIAFESMSYDEAVERHRLAGLPRPAVNDVRVVSAPAVKPGDFCLDEDEEADDSEYLFRGAWVFLEGLTVGGALTNSEMDAGPVLAVRGTLRVQRWWLTGLDALIWGDLVVERLLITQYSHGTLRVEGQVEAPLVMIDDHETVLVHAPRGAVFDSRADAASQVDPRCVEGGKVGLSLLWDLAATDQPLILPSDTAPNRSEADPEFVMARRMVDHWITNAMVVLSPGIDVDDFAEVLAKAFDRHRAHQDPAAALGEWLLERPEVEEVLAEDGDLARLLPG